MLGIKRVYEDPSSDDGYRILVDRLWARGETKVKAHLDHWAKEMAPSDEVRKSFNHESDKFDEFVKAYTDEINNNPESKEFLDLIRRKLKDGNVTLLYGAKNETMNNAVVLKQWLEEHL